MEVSTWLFQDSGGYCYAVAFVPQVAKKSAVNICSFFKCVPSLSPDRVDKFDNIPYTTSECIENRYMYKVSRLKHSMLTQIMLYLYKFINLLPR